MSRFEIRHGRGLVRFLYFFNYPKEMSIADGDEWYFAQHVNAAKKLPGLVRFRSWKGLPPIKMWTYDPYDRFARVSELAFENFEACLQATTRNKTGLFDLTSDGKPGFRELECIMLDEDPQYDLLKDVPVQQFKYAANPPKYSGEPDIDEADDTFLDIYMFNYRVPVPDGEDWYLGHHVREGRIIKQLGRKHYQTWKSLQVPEEAGSTLKPNRFYRITELGLADWYRGKPRPGGPPKSQLIFTRSPLGEVIGEWRNILIDPNDRQEIKL